MLRKKILSALIAITIMFAPAAYLQRTGLTVFADDEQVWNFGVESFIRDLYAGCLYRDADEAGLSYWYGKITSGEVTGKQAAYGFFYSQEFLRSLPLMTEEEVINRFYNVFLGRNADADGLLYWTQMLKSGGGPDELFAGFADSQEFLSRCEMCGVNAGPHINVPDLPSYWAEYSTAFNLMRLVRGYPIDDAAVLGSIADQCNYWAGLESSGSPDALRYVLGGKTLQPGGGIDCSGFVTAVYKRAFGTQSLTYAGVYDPDLYLSSHNYMGSWRAGVDQPAPVNEGVYSTIGDNGRPVYVDRYGMASGFAMNTFQWHYYLQYLGMRGNSYLTWRVSDYTQEQVEQMLDVRGFKPGDIIIWYTTAVDAPHSEHIGIYAGGGMFWHCTSMLENGVCHTPVSYIGSYEDTVIQYCRIYHMS